MNAVFNSVNRADALRYMGCRGEPDERMTAQIDECEKALLAAARPQYVWKAFELVRENGALGLSGCDFRLPGSDIAKHLENCGSAAVIAATLSADTDRFLKKQSVEDSLKAMISDALASALVEQTAEAARVSVLQSMEGYFATWCYAAGYGDFPIEMTPLLIACTDAARKIGIGCTASNMITPQKTIVGIIGLSEKPQNGSRGCESCKLRDTCGYRKNGQSCQ